MANESWHPWITDKVYEPTPRLCGGVYGYVGHRFPIKNGISKIEVMKMQFGMIAGKPNKLYWKLNPDGSLEKK